MMMMTEEYKNPSRVFFYFVFLLLLFGRLYFCCHTTTTKYDGRMDLFAKCMVLSKKCFIVQHTALQISSAKQIITYQSSRVPCPEEEDEVGGGERWRKGCPAASASSTAPKRLLLSLSFHVYSPPFLKSSWAEWECPFPMNAGDLRSIIIPLVAPCCHAILDLPRWGGKSSVRGWLRIKI